MGTGDGRQCAMTVRNKLSHCAGHDAELVMASGREPGRPEGPALLTHVACALDPPAEDVREVAHTVTLHHAGAPFPASVPMDPETLAERTMARSFHRLKEAVAQFLEFPIPVV